MQPGFDDAAFVIHARCIGRYSRVRRAIIDKDVKLPLRADVGPGYVVLWAHAGVTATPAQIDALLAKWPKLSVELSLRDDVAPQGQVDPKWRDLLLKYSDRFMVGTDTWTVGGSYTGNERWDAYADIVNRIRGWLMQLPDEPRAAIAYKNAERFLAQLPR